MTGVSRPASRASAGRGGSGAPRMHAEQPSRRSPVSAGILLYRCRGDGVEVLLGLIERRSLP